MKIFFGQIYIQPTARMPFSHTSQSGLSEIVSALVEPSKLYQEKYGEHSNLMINISAKNGIQANEIRGPSQYKKQGPVEYTIFLPYDIIESQPSFIKSALYWILDGLCSVLTVNEINIARLIEQRDAIIEYNTLSRSHRCFDQVD